MGPVPHSLMLGTISLQGLKHGLPRTPNTSSIFLFLSPFVSFSFFPCTEVLEALIRPSKEAFSQLGLVSLGPLLSMLGTLG